MQVELFHDCRCSLGEGLHIESNGQRVFWLDIIESTLYSKDIASNLVISYVLGNCPSVIFKVVDNYVYLADEVGILQFDIEKKTTVYISKNKDIEQNPFFRSNDGVLLTDDSYLYGTMSKENQLNRGDLYLFDGDLTVCLDVPIHIPNTFIVTSKGKLLISDSYTSQVLQYSYSAEEKKLKFEKVWFDFSSWSGVPDGGCICDGFVYICLWDGSAVVKLSEEGEVIKEIPLPVLRPTNCKLHDGLLYITSAASGLNKKQLKDYPYSGALLKLKLE